MTLHRQLLQHSIEFYLPHAQRLKGAAFCVTGASGFMASSLLAFLCELSRAGGLGLRLFANARKDISEVALFRFLEIEPEIEWTKSPVEKAMLPDVADLIVIHTASYGSPVDYLREPIATYEANTSGLIHLFGQGRGLRQFIYFSSAEIYGQPPDSMIPTPESYVGGLDTLATRSIYGESKRMAEVLGSCLGKQQGVPFTVIRPWNIYGPGQRLDDGRVPVEFIRQAKQDHSINLASNGMPRRAFCHIWDAILQITGSLGHPEAVAAFNIGNPFEEISILELARQCAAACGLSSGVVSFDSSAQAAGLNRCAPDITSVCALLAQAPDFIPLDAGLATLVEWYEFTYSHE